MPSRVVHQGDGVAWLEQTTLGREHAVVTSLPDVSEVPLDFDAWRAWFVATARLACERTHRESVAIFFQTDIKHEGRWVDKAYLVQRGAEEAGSALLFHKVVCRAPAGTTTFGRPAYAHLLCFSRDKRLDPGRSTPDVLERLGAMTWARAMGVEVCEAVMRFLVAETSCSIVVDPFAGLGTMLAVANARGFDAVGVELSKKRARRAETFSLERLDERRRRRGDAELAAPPSNGEHREP
jgi:hypothetical protein